MNKKSVVNWAVRLGSIAFVTAVVGSLASQPPASEEKAVSSDNQLDATIFTSEKYTDYPFASPAPYEGHETRKKYKQHEDRKEHEDDDDNHDDDDRDRSFSLLPGDHSVTDTRTRAS